MYGARVHGLGSTGGVCRIHEASPDVAQMRGDSVLDGVDLNSVVGEALGLLVDGLAPYVAKVMGEALPDELAWTSILRLKDVQGGRPARVYSERDLSLVLRAMTERLGDLGYPFSQHLSRQGQSYASELREVRNQWAHNQPFTAATARRALDSAELLLREIGAMVQAEAVSASKAEISDTMGHGALSGHGQLPATDEASPGSVLGSAPAVAIDRPTIEISISALPVMSYAMAHCRIPVVTEVSVTAHGRDFRGSVLELEVTSDQGSLGEPKMLVLDLADGQTTMLRDCEVVLDPAKMLTIDEQQGGHIRAVLRSADRVDLASRAVEVQILAANQWKAQPEQLGMEIVAAHVQPNSVAIAPLLLEASDLLMARTGLSSLDGYQSEDPKRTDAIAAAVYEGMRRRDIRYAEPPASWGGQGQKVRTPSEVLEGRLGTCLDTTLTLAAALEQAGINSTLWFLEGHIFLGYWREPGTLEAVTSTDVAGIVNLADLGQIGVIETTLITGGANESKPFDAAVAHARGRLAGDIGGLKAVTDIRRAREQGIYPLPSRSISHEGIVQVSMYQPAPNAVIATFEPGSTPSSEQKRTSVPPRVSRWKNALLDLSLRNKLINYTGRSGFRLEVPGNVLPRFEDQVNAGVPLTLLASDQVSSVDAERGTRYGRDLSEEARGLLLTDKKSAFIDITSTSYQVKLRYLAYKAKTIQEETGSNNLYLAFGMLAWRFGDRDLRSPLVLIPVSLATTSRGQTYRLLIDESGASTPNYCLLEKLKVAFDMEVPGLAEPAHDSSGIDLQEALDAMRRAIAAAGLPFRVEETAELAILQFAKFPLWRDLDQHWGAFSANSLVSHLVHSPLEVYADPVQESAQVDLDELGAALPVPADSSQLDAVAAAVGGQTFVLEGPPGTGKSQTITNLLARALHSGHRVLFVAEKRAALDVVKKRLEAVGLGELSLDLHDKSARPSAVRAQIKAALDLRVRADHDALRTQAESAESSRRRLAAYADRLHRPNGVGHSLYSAHVYDLASDRTIEPLPISAALIANLGSEEYDELRGALRRLPEVADLARPRPDHPWRFLDERPDAHIETDRASAAARAFDDALQALLNVGVTEEQLASASSPEELDTWAQLSIAPLYAVSVLEGLAAVNWQNHILELQRDLSPWVAGPGSWPAAVTPDAVSLDVPTIHAAAIAADSSSFFGRKRRRQAVLERLSGVLVDGPSSIPLKHLSTLTESLASATARISDLRSRLDRIPLPVAAHDFNPAIPGQAAQVSSGLGWLIWLNQTLFAHGLAQQQSRVRLYERPQQRACESELRAFAAAWRTLAAVLQISAGQRESGSAESFVQLWLRGRRERQVDTGASLSRWIDLVRHLEPLRHHGLHEARTAILDGRVAADDAVLAFDRGVARASVTERAEATMLKDFDIDAHNRTIARFSSSTRAVRSELPRAIPEAVLTSRHFDVTSTSGQMGGLRRQLERQRGGMSVRGLLDNYGQLITEIMPCTLMSPESVARFFPAKADIFDVVVFDEASQIRVADAIGAMGRARSVVVVGDSKQMPPTQFAEASVSIEDDEDLVENVLDEESILSECVQARVPSKWLSWHYRSQDESLIAFSNHHYYETRLTSFPAPLSKSGHGQLEGYGVSLVRVNGTFERGGRGRTLRTNKVEAEAIIDDVRQRFWASPDVSPSLGVITFNAQQRDLIENLLRDSEDERIVRALDEPDGLFVKNLENVQGDERDCILFSVAFSANEKGVVPLNFGPLSRPGGERRLNVAVTRARRQVVLYASFDPEALRAEETSQKGTKHLKAYLEMAARGAEVLGQGGRRQPVIDRHRDEIAAALSERGHIVKTDVGLSDFRIDLSIAEADDPESPLVAVLLDGTSWRSRRTVADRDGLPVDVLKGLMGWPRVERIWLPEWIGDREAVITRMAAAVRMAKVGQEETIPPVRPAGGPAEEERRDNVVPVPLPNSAPSTETLIRSAPAPATRPSSGHHPLRTAYRGWTPQQVADLSVLDALPEPWAVAAVRSVAVTIINAEGPIHPDRLARSVAAAFGLHRVAGARRDAILRTVPESHRPKRGDGFLWPAEIDPLAWQIVRNDESGGLRPLDEVSLNEIANAMRVVAEESGGMSSDELKRGSLGEFGGRRMTSAIEARLDRALAFAVKVGYVVAGPDGIYRSNKRS